MAGREGAVAASAASNVVCCGGDPGVSECTVQQWVVAEKTNSPD